MRLQAALPVAVLSTSAFADAVLPRQNNCVVCTEVIPTCPVCPDNERCLITDPAPCTDCPRAYCAEVGGGVTPTPAPTPTPGGSSSSSTNAGFTSPTVSGGQTITVSTTTTAAPTGPAGNVTVTATASSSPAASSPSSAAPSSADPGVMLRAALLAAVSVLGLQARLW